MNLAQIRGRTTDPATGKPFDQAAFARWLGVSQATLSKVENGSPASPKLRRLIEIRTNTKLSQERPKPKPLIETVTASEGALVRFIKYPADVESLEWARRSLVVIRDELRNLVEHY